MKEMMEEIEVKNLKGQSRKISFTKRATLIFGPNDTGKTTIIDGLKLILLRFHPAVNRTARDVIRVFGAGKEVDVRGRFKGGATIHRRYALQGNGASITESNSLPLDHQETPVVLLDAAVYLGATDRGKVEMMFAAGRLNSEPGAMKEVINTLGDMLHDVKRVIKIDGSNPQEWVTNAIAGVESARSEAAAGAKRMEGTLQGLAGLRAADTTAKSLNEGIEASLTQARGELEALQRKLSDRKRITALDKQSPTPDEKAVDDQRRRLKTVISFIAEKEAEKEKQTKKWAKLLDPTNEIFCLKCMENAKKKRDADLKEIDGHKSTLLNERDALEVSIKKSEPIAIKAREKLDEQNREHEMALEEAIMEKKEAIKAAEAGYQDIVNARSDRKRLAEAQGERENYEKAAKQLEAAKKYLLGVKAKMVNELFDPIIKTAALFTRGTFFEKHPLEFFDGELGIHRDGAWIPHEAFGGARQAIAFAALQAALGATAPIKLVVIDEIDRVDKTNRKQLFLNIEAALKAGVIDQFIAVGVTNTGVPKSFGLLSTGEK